MGKRVFAFTGMPGVRVQEAARRLAASLSDVEVICVDEHIKALFQENIYKEENHALRSAIQLTPHTECSWYHILRAPSEYIKLIWKKAAAQVIIKAKESTKETIFLCFHAVFFSDSTRSFFSAVDPAAFIGKDLHFGAFFTLIDDIYDLFARIPQDIKGVKYRATEPLESVIEIISKSTTYLNLYISWRQTEIVINDMLAKSLDVPSHILAIKHPLETARRLITTPGESAYFSHPISKIRPTDTGVPREVLDIAEVCRTLRSRVTMIEPTSIDEARFRSFTKSDRRIGYLPGLTPRWPLLTAANELIYAQEGEINSIVPAKPRSVLNDERQHLLREIEIGRASSEILERVSSIIQPLVDRIWWDITWRDHHLVEQTKKLVVYRPALNGAKSVGIKRELEYYKKCILWEENHLTHLKGLVYHPQEDVVSQAKDLADKIFTSWEKTLSHQVQPALTDLPDRNAFIDNLASLIATKPLEEIAGASASLLLEQVSIIPSTESGLPMLEGVTTISIDDEASLRSKLIAEANTHINNDMYFQVLLNDTRMGLSRVSDLESLRHRVSEINRA